MVIGWQCRSSSAEQTRVTEARIHRGGAVLWTRGRVGERTVRRIDPHVTRIIDRQEAAGCAAIRAIGMAAWPWQGQQQQRALTYFGFSPICSTEPQRAACTQLEGA